MCGIGGILRYNADSSAEELGNIVRSMAGVQSHRGPDAEGCWADAASGIAFSHRRLSIIDLNDAGRQPMVSRSGRYAITYNGEVYNYRELRSSLENDGVRFRTQTDTEVLLEAIEAWGVVGALQKINGMFAFGIWDRDERRLYLARDAFGIKPMYVGFVPEAIVFASELQAIRRASPALRVASSALTDFFQYGFVPGARSIYSECWKVPPGAVLCLSMQNEACPEDFSPAPEPFRNARVRSASMYRFWSYAEELQAGAESVFSGSEQEAVRELERLLQAAVKRQCVADVPLGAFLSGGIDSSAVVAMMCASAGLPVRTFSIGVENAQIDESGFARDVAAHLKTEHRELRVSEAEALKAAMRVGRIYDEPFADSSQIATLLVSQMASKEVKVVLTGDGGDEIFGGYNRHVHGVSLWHTIQALPPGAREAIASLVDSKTWKGVDRIAEALLSSVIPALKHRSLENAREKVGKIAGAHSVAELYRNLISNTSAAETYTRAGAAVERREAEGLPELDDARKLMYLDAVGYLHDDILAKVDRATMSCSLEARVPLLDQDVARFAARMPTGFLIQGKSGKQLLKRVLSRYIPETLIERPKMGFAVPLTEWLRGPLKEWALDSLRAAEAKTSDVLNWPNLRVEIERFYSGESNNSGLLWSFVMFAEWSQAQR